MEKSKHKSHGLYKDYRIGKYVFTVKFTFTAGIDGGPAVVVHVMDWHQPPHNLWGRIFETWKYSLNCGIWDPMLTEASLEAYAIDKCKLETVRRLNVERGYKEWETF